MGNRKGFVHSVETFGVLDGPGIRYVIFLQGCPLRCRYCHNPDTWQMSVPGIRCVTAEELVCDVLKYKNYIDTGGVTLSGGEPLAQPEFALDLVRLCRENGFHVAIDTAGSVPLPACEKIIVEADLIILDFKALDADMCREITGQDNVNAIELLDYCERTGKDVWIRHVVVPGLTLDYARLDKMAAFLSGYGCIKKTELLPFHKMGEYKWKSMGLDYKLYHVNEPTVAQMEKAIAIFKGYGLV